MIRLAEDSKCFVCGQQSESGIKARFLVDRENRRATCRLVLNDRFQGWQGIAHGGILASLLDEASIYACRSMGERFVTAELSVRFIKPVQTGVDVEIVAEVTEVKRKIYMVDARLEMAGEVCAEAKTKVYSLD